MPKNAQQALADPSMLKSYAKGSGTILQVVIETPKGSRNKYALDDEEKVYRLKTVLPAGMAFPYDFGFIPSTEAEDGDPLDVLVLMDEPAFPGCVLQCRLIGVIEGEEVSGKKSVRNDRLIAVAKKNHSWSDIQHIRDLDDRFCRELEQFFVDYHKLSDEKFRVIGVRGPKTAHKLVRKHKK
jgi:inorganic pyrophosphatase